jgi:hypothetical protein
MCARSDCASTSRSAAAASRSRRASASDSASAECAIASRDATAALDAAAAAADADAVAAQRGQRSAPHGASMRSATVSECCASLAASAAPSAFDRATSCAHGARHSLTVPGADRADER